MRAALALPLVLLFGCAFTFETVGVPVPDPSALEVGTTTKAEALALLGAPRLVRMQFDGDLYTWRLVKGSSRSLTLFPVYVEAFFYSDGVSRRDDLSLLFDREGVLRGVGLRLETQE